jgi:hypothetical protein
MTNPWPNAQQTFTNIILLPPATIVLSAPWILTSDTRLVGEGTDLTVLRAGFTGADMIDMGSFGPPMTGVCPWDPVHSISDCQAVAIEHLTLDGNNNSNVNGIVNVASQELSYVNDVKLLNITGTGLTISSQSAVNSGPYSNIYFSGTGACLNINSTYDTRGIHGLTCITNANPGILVDGSNNTFEDISIQVPTNGPFVPDGILVGSHQPAQGNVFINVQGGPANLGNLIRISNALTNGVANATDTSIMGITSTATVTVQDDLNSKTLADRYVGMYVLGEAFSAFGTSGVGYSRFTTSPNVPTWLVGTSAPPSSTGVCATGSLYSCTSSLGNCTSAGTTTTLWGCIGGQWKKLT